MTSGTPATAVAYYATRTLLCALALLTLLVIPDNAMLGGRQIQVWWTAVGGGSALILWGTGVAIWLMGRSLLRSGTAPAEPGTRAARRRAG